MTVDRVLAFIGALLWGGVVGVGCGAMIGFIVGYRGGARARRAELPADTAPDAHPATIELDFAHIRPGCSTLYHRSLTGQGVLALALWERQNDPLDRGLDAIIATPEQLARWHRDFWPSNTEERTFVRGEVGITVAGIPIVVENLGWSVHYAPGWRLVLDARSAT